MCGRFALYADPRVLQDRFDLVEIADYKQRYNISPSAEIAGITKRADGRHLELYRWGLVPSWAKEIGKFSTFNAKAETVQKAPAYRGPFRYHRCLIPADGYYEWQKVGEGKQPWYIRAADGQPMALAGLFDVWQGELQSATVIVADAGKKTEHIHNRAPVILPEESWDAWLAPETDVEALIELLRPAPDDYVKAVPVSSRVNNSRNEGPGCINELSSGSEG